MVKGKKVNFSMNIQFADDVKKGLSTKHKFLSSKYFYDDKGSQLFQEIMQLEEYYPTNCEFEIFENNKSKILNLIDAKNQGFKLIEFGAGDGLKTKILLNYFVEQQVDFTYSPVDISEEAIRGLEQSLHKEIPELKIKCMVKEYFEALNELKSTSDKPSVLLFLGSNIGNFADADALDFLKQIHQNLNPDDFVIIGMDLKKNPDTIIEAYNDKKGVTRDFNLNLLERINRELEADFDLSKFIHYPIYDPKDGAAKSFLVSTKDQEVFIKKINLLVKFEAWETIHTENSYKYAYSQIKEMAKNAGFEIIENLTDKKNYFVNSIWKRL